MHDCSCLIERVIHAAPRRSAHRVGLHMNKLPTIPTSGPVAPRQPTVTLAPPETTLTSITPTVSPPTYMRQSSLKHVSMAGVRLKNLLKI